MPSLNPEDAKHGGGLISDLDLTVVESKFSLFDYGGKGTPTPALMLSLEDDDKNMHEQAWSAGSARMWLPGEDGDELVQTGTETQLSDSCNMMFMLQSLVNAGFPKNLLASGKASVLKGLKAHWERVPAPARPGLKQEPRPEGREATILTVTKIISLPGEKAKGGKAAAGKAAVGSKKAEESGGDLEGKAVEFVMAELTKAGDGGLPKSKLATNVFNANKKDGDIQKIAAMIYKDDFHAGKPWTVENGVVSLG
jgi:hypothetical protein